VAAIRKALGDSQFGNRYIANVRGRGYSFVGTVVSPFDQRAILHPLFLCPP
jgi:DNA-binding winged helix-turn-helix (wHTH) protein